MSFRKAIALLFVLVSIGTPAVADPASATLSGVVRGSDGQAPLAGARVFAGDSATGEVFPSEPTEVDGTFEIHGLPPATYDLAVESGEGLYVIERPVVLDAGSEQAVGISVAPGMGISGPDGLPIEGQPLQPKNAAGRLKWWNNPGAAAVFVIGIAIIFGYFINKATNDEDTLPEEPMSPMDMES